MRFLNNLDIILYLVVVSLQIILLLEVPKVVNQNDINMKLEEVNANLIANLEEVVIEEVGNLKSKMELL